MARLPYDSRRKSYATEFLGQLSKPSCVIAFGIDHSEYYHIARPKGIIQIS
jgi:hypothetical protein